VPKPPDIQERPPDTCPIWDTDCDDISNAVETNDANSYLNLNPSIKNANSSIAHGTPYNGWIEKAFNMVNTGTGYWHYNPEKVKAMDTDDWGVLHLINMIEGAGRNWYSDGLVPPRISVGDLSWGDASTLNFGGPWPGGDHAWHQNGLEVDVRYVRKDDEELPLNIHSNPANYDNIATMHLINRLGWNSKMALIIISPDCRIDFYDSSNIVFDSIDRKHDDHFHYRIVDPDGTDN